MCTWCIVCHTHTHRLFLDQESPNGTFLRHRSQSSDALRKISVNSSGSSILQDSDFHWRRSRSLSDTQKGLDEALKSLEQEIAEDLEQYQTTLTEGVHYSSNDSAMDESGHMLSPLQSGSEPSTLNRKRDMFVSRDSAFSNNSSPMNSSEGINSSDIYSMESDSPFMHTRMSSGISGLSNMSGVSREESNSPAPGTDSPKQVASPRSNDAQYLHNTASLSSLPTVNGYPRRTSPHHHFDSTLSNDDTGMTMSTRKAHTLPPALATHSVTRQTKKQYKKLKNIESMSSSTGGYGYAQQRSPILNTKEHKFHSETQLHILSCEGTPTESCNNISSSPSVYSLDSGNYHSHTEGTVI